MAISRRKFLGRSSVFSFAALLPFASHARDTAGMSSALDTARHDMLSGLTSESFSKNLHTTFEIQVSALHTQQLELIEVSRERVRRGNQSFDVVFRAQKENQFEQGTYMIRHSTMGCFPVFVVPIGNKKDSNWYQAVFSRMG